MNEYLLIDMLFGTTAYNLWTGEGDEQFASLIPTHGATTYKAVPHVDLQPLREGVSSGWPTMQLSLALPEGHALDASLRDAEGNWPIALRLVSDLSGKPAVTADAVFLGDAIRQEKRDGLWSIRCQHFLHRLDVDEPEPAMGFIEHQRTYPGDLGFAFLEHSAAFLDNWSP